MVTVGVSKMNNEAFVSNLLSFLNFILKSVGLAPFSYSKSKRLFVSCKFSTFLSCVISGCIITISLPIELTSAIHFKPYRNNTVSYTIGYLHIFFTLVKIWLNQILPLTNRSRIIRHFNQAFHINDALASLCKDEHLLDEQMVYKIKQRILLFIVQSVAIIFGVNVYISRSFFKHNAVLLVRIFVCFSYINAIFVTTIYLGGSLMLCERYCTLLCKRVRLMIDDVKGKCFGRTTDPNERIYELKLHEKLGQILKAYDVIILFIDNSHTLFASHAVICACSTFLIMLHGVICKLYMSRRVM